jgi:hypothetical protein
LPRKNIWDLTEHLVLVPKHQKSRNTQYIHTIRVKCHKITRKHMILEILYFGYESFICDLKKTFDNSQMICWEKISEISQSTSCSYQNNKKSKHSIYTYN